MYTNKPSLVDPEIKNTLKQILLKCNYTKTEYYSKVYNIVFLLGFVTLLGTILYYRYSQKIQNNIHIQDTNDKKREYILTTLEKMTKIEYDKKQYENNQPDTKMITDLPKW